MLHVGADIFPAACRAESDQAHHLETRHAIQRAGELMIRISMPLADFIVIANTKHDPVLPAQVITAVGVALMAALVDSILKAQKHTHPETDGWKVPSAPLSYAFTRIL